MAQVKVLTKLSYDEIVSSNNKVLKENLIPAGYPLWETSKIFDNAFQEPINLPSYKVERLIKKLDKNE
jgi:hypothetical protein